jgi:hypothetical protein
MVTINYPPGAGVGGPGFWRRPKNIWAARRKLTRMDASTAWRQSFKTDGDSPFPDRSVPFSALLGRPPGPGFRFLILGDTGEGDRSQYGLLPLIRAMAADFIIINGDVAYPAGEAEDFTNGFFEPYRNLGIPIWAVPGNHEYYSTFKGREFFDIFCTRRYAAQWDRYGLRLVPQPGTYWEIKEPGGLKLAVTALDTGQGDVDGKGWFNPPDSEQLMWLQRHLDQADHEQAKVIVLFHIPGLVRQTHDSSTHFRKLHQVLVTHPCVRLIVCGHEHNYQRYEAATFGQYLQACQDIPTLALHGPEYIVCGAGGAFLHSTDFKRADYPASEVYPNLAQWRQHVKMGTRIVDAAGLSKTLVGTVAGYLEDATRADSDVAEYMSFLLVEVSADPANTANTAVAVTPIFMDGVEDLFQHLPAGSNVQIEYPGTPPDPQQVNRCLQNDSRVLL